MRYLKVCPCLPDLSVSALAFTPFQLREWEKRVRALRR